MEAHLVVPRALVARMLASPLSNDEWSSVFRSFRFPHLRFPAYFQRGYRQPPLVVCGRGDESHERTLAHIRDLCVSRHGADRVHDISADTHDLFFHIDADVVFVRLHGRALCAALDKFELVAYAFFVFSVTLLPDECVPRLRPSQQLGVVTLADSPKLVCATTQYEEAYAILCRPVGKQNPVLHAACYSRSMGVALTSDALSHISSFLPKRMSHFPSLRALSHVQSLCMCSVEGADFFARVTARRRRTYVGWVAETRYSQLIRATRTPRFSTYRSSLERTGADDDAECTICLEKVGTTDGGIQCSLCRKSFHAACFRDWGMRNCHEDDTVICPAGCMNRIKMPFSCPPAAEMLTLYVPSQANLSAP